MAHYRYAPPMQATDAMRFGTLVHCGQLEPDKLSERYAVMPDFSAQCVKPEGTPYANPKATRQYKELVDQWKTAHTDRDVVTVTIQGGELRELEGKSRLQIHFEEPVRPLILNKTNATQIAKLHGEEATKWRGKQITLYATTCDFAGRTVPCIRIRDQVPQKMPQPSQPPQTEQPQGNPVMRF